MEFQSDWSGSIEGDIAFEDIGSQFSSFFSASDGSYSDLSSLSSSISNSSLTSLALTDGIPKVVSARSGQLSASTQAWLCEIANQPECYLDVQRSKGEHSISGGSQFDLGAQGKLIPINTRSDAEGSGINVLPRNSARPVTYKFMTRMTKSRTEYQHPTDQSIASSGESFETETGSNVSVSSDESVMSRRNYFVDQFVRQMVGFIDSRLASCVFQTHTNGTNGDNSVSQQSRESSVSFRSQDAASFREKSCKRKKKEREGDDDDDDDGDDLQRKRRGSSTQPDEAHGREFACHFFKHNPQRYSEMKSCRCSTAGWRSIHRLKYAHLYNYQPQQVREGRLTV